jgi:two-component system, cell cycle response regulator CtrA
MEWFLRELQQVRLDPRPIDLAILDDLVFAHREIPASAGILLSETVGKPALIRRLRSAGQGGPILVHRDVRNARATTEVLDAGADDDMTMPLKPREIAARIQAALRRRHGHAAAQIMLGSATVDLCTGETHLGSKAIELTQTEQLIFQQLCLRKGHVVSREDLFEILYGLAENKPYIRAVDVHIFRLREKLRGSGGWIRSVTSQGFALEEGSAEGGFSGKI